jgi:hypothetical protein
MIDKILQFFKDQFASMKEFLHSLVLSISDMLKDLFFWIIETVINSGKVLLAGISGTPEFSLANYMTALPYEARNVLALTGLPECIVLIFIAIGLRFTLQLIPFTRLGS